MNDPAPLLGQSEQPSQEVLTEQALRIDRDPPTPAERVRLDADMSLTAAVHARSTLDLAVQRLEQQQGGGEEALWVTWPLRTVARALEDAINAAR